MNKKPSERPERKLSVPGQPVESPPVKKAIASDPEPELANIPFYDQAGPDELRTLEEKIDRFGELLEDEHGEEFKQKFFDLIVEIRETPPPKTRAMIDWLMSSHRPALHPVYANLVNDFLTEWLNIKRNSNG